MAAYSSERGAAIAIIIVVTIILYLSFLQRNKLIPNIPCESIIKYSFRLIWEFIYIFLYIVP